MQMHSSGIPVTWLNHAVYYMDTHEIAQSQKQDPVLSKVVDAPLIPHHQRVDDLPKYMLQTDLVAIGHQGLHNFGSGSNHVPLSKANW